MRNQYFFPSIWLGNFTSKREFDARTGGAFFDVLDTIDDRMLASRHGFSLKAYCAACEAITSMSVTWHFCGTNQNGDVNPAWTETSVCGICGLNSRMRALVDFLTSQYRGPEIRRVFLAERTTPTFKVFKSRYKHVIGSEYLGPQFRPGQIAPLVNGHPLVRHEDITALSFPPSSFDLVVTQDVFEHIPLFPKAFAECARVLSPGGRLLFTIPFSSSQQATVIRASVAADGNIEHHLPAEFHGNPMSAKGILCFQNFGWDVLDSLQKSGFEDVFAAMYWGPWQGHLGFPFFVFSAHRSHA